MRWRFASLPLLIALLVGACGGSEQSPREARPPRDPPTAALRTEQPPGVLLRLDRDKAAPGDVVKATMKTDSQTFLVGNPHTLEQLVGDEWRPPQSGGPAMPFTLEGIFLRPGEPFETRVRLPPSLPPGRYRITKEASPIAETGEPTGPAQQVSAMFRVASGSN